MTQTYLSINADIILINSHGLKAHETLKLQGYTSYKINSTNENNDGSAILMKNNIPHRINDENITDILEVIIKTDVGELGIATTYLPPRRPYLPYPDFNRLATKNRPTYIIGDLNAKIRYHNQANLNQVGKGLERLFNNGHLSHLGPQFATYYDRRSNTSPDMVLGNRTVHNITIDPGPITESDHIPLHSPLEQ